MPLILEFLFRFLLDGVDAWPLRTPWSRRSLQFELHDIFSRAAVEKQREGYLLTKRYYLEMLQSQRVKGSCEDPMEDLMGEPYSI